MSYRNELLLRLRTYLEPHRFQALPSLSQYRRATEAGFHNVIISAGSTLPVIAELQMGIRIDMVERLIYQFTNGLSNYGPHSTTLLVSIGQLQSQPYQRYEVTRPADVGSVAQAMREAIEADGFDFFQHYDSTAALDELYNATDTRWLPHFGHRSLRGITLAKLAHRNGWPELVANYREQLQQRGTPEVMMNRYDQLVAYLRHFSMN